MEDLEKASESAHYENRLLRAQVERLQYELKEYRKSTNTIGGNEGKEGESYVEAACSGTKPTSYPYFSGLHDMNTERLGHHKYEPNVQALATSNLGLPLYNSSTADVVEAVEQEGSAFHEIDCGERSQART